VLPAYSGDPLRQPGCLHGILSKSRRDPLALRTGLATGVPFVRYDLAGAAVTERRDSIHQLDPMLKGSWKIVNKNCM